MKFRGPIIAAIVLLALSAVLYWSNRHPSTDDTAKTSASASPKILTLDQSEITAITVRKKGEPPVQLAKNGTAWQITSPKTLAADQSTVSGILSTVSSLNSDSLVDDKASDLAQYGLADPAIEIDVTAKDKTQKLLLGEQTINGNSTYAELAGDPRVFTIASYNKSSLDKSLFDLRNKKLFDFGYTDPSKIEIHDGAKSYLFTHSASDWFDGGGKKLDSAPVQTLLNKLRGLSATAFPDSGFASPAMQIAVVSDDGKRTEKISLSKSATTCIANRENDPVLYELPAATVSDLQQAAASLRPAAPPAPTPSATNPAPNKK